MVFTLGLRHTFALWQRALALVQFPLFRHRSLRLWRCRKNLPLGGRDQTLCELFAPRNLRPYQRIVDRLTPYFPRLWYIGIPAIAITSFVTGHDTFWVLLACNLTIYPALFIFFSLPAIGAIWRILLRAPVGKPIGAWLGFLLVLAFPTVFFCFGFVIYASAIWHMVSAA